MQITLNETEILEAIEEKVRSQITIEGNQDIKITLRAGRGPDGFTAALDITEKAETSSAKKKKPATRSVTESGSAELAKEVTETTTGNGCALPDRPEPSGSLFDTEDDPVDASEDVVATTDAAITLNPENRQEEPATSIFG